jgi:hypothetical protein
MDSHSGAGGSTVEHEEVMVVDLGVDRLGPRILEVVL